MNYELLAKVIQPVHQYFYIYGFSVSICPCFVAAVKHKKYYLYTVQLYVLSE